MISVLDEATSQVGVDSEEKLYNMCRDLGITVLSVGHRSSLRRYHDMELRIVKADDWSIQPITESGSVVSS